MRPKSCLQWRGRLEICIRLLLGRCLPAIVRMEVEEISANTYSMVCRRHFFQHCDLVYSSFVLAFRLYSILTVANYYGLSSPNKRS